MVQSVWCSCCIKVIWVRFSVVDVHCWWVPDRSSTNHYIYIYIHIKKQQLKAFQIKQYLFLLLFPHWFRAYFVLKFCIKFKLNFSSDLTFPHCYSEERKAEGIITKPLFQLTTGLQSHLNAECWSHLIVLLFPLQMVNLKILNCDQFYFSKFLVRCFIKPTQSLRHWFEPRALIFIMNLW